MTYCPACERDHQEYENGGMGMPLGRCEYLVQEVNAVYGHIELRECGAPATTDGLVQARCEEHR